MPQIVRGRPTTRTICGTPRPPWRIAAGANIKAVQRMLGHASAAMTLDVYAGLFGDDLDAVAALFDSHVPHLRHSGEIEAARDGVQDGV